MGAFVVTYMRVGTKHKTRILNTNIRVFVNVDYSGNIEGILLRVH